MLRASAEERAWLDHYLGFPDAKARFAGRRAGRRPMFNAFLDTFPAGLLPLVREGAREAELACEVVDARGAPPCKPDPRADLGWLLDYQEEAVEAGYAAGRGVFHCPTGSGKTEVMVALCAALPCDWLILVHRKSLLKEIAERFELRTGEKAGVVGDGAWREARVTVAMFQTVYAGLRARTPRVLALLARARGMHVDECHTVPSDSFWQCAVAAPNAYWRFGYSGTPFARGDRKGLLVVAALGPVVYRIAARELVARGAVARPKVVLVRLPLEPSGAQTWVEASDDLVALSPARNRAVLDLAAAAPKPALVFVRLQDHGKVLERLGRQRGLATEFVWGAKNTHEREAAVRRLEHGDTDVLVASVVFQEGVNIPGLRTVVHAAGGASAITTLQNAGRGMRRRDRAGNVTKDAFLVLDIADAHCGCRHKREDGKWHYHHKTCAWFARHTRARRAAYLGERYEVVEAELAEALAVCTADAERP